MPFVISILDSQDLTKLLRLPPEAPPQTILLPVLQSTPPYTCEPGATSELTSVSYRTLYMATKERMADEDSFNLTRGFSIKPVTAGVALFQ